MIDDYNIDTEEYQEYEEYINEIIAEDVSRYKKRSYDYLNSVKILIFTYLILDSTYGEFNRELNRLTQEYDSYISKHQKADFEYIDKRVKGTGGEVLGSGENFVLKNKLDKLKFKLDTSSSGKAKEVYIKRIKNYYKATKGTMNKPYIIKESYLNDKLSKYDKVEKVVAYYDKNGKVISYHDIADYNSMVYNSNLTSEQWNDTIDKCKDTLNDIVYVPPHPFSCPECQIWQGRFYSLSGLTKGYTSIEEAIEGGLKHPNCKHPIEPAGHQKITNDYSSEEWVSKYEAQQKYRSLNLKKNRLETDKAIYKKLNNEAKVDEINQRLEKITSEISYQLSIMKS